MKEQATVPPCHKVYKRGCVIDHSAECIHKNTDDSSDNEIIPAPLIPHGVKSGVNWQFRQTLTSFNLLVTGTRHNVVPHINKDLIPCNLFIFLFSSHYHLAGEGDQLLLPTILGLLDDKPPYVLNVTESGMFLFLAIIIQIGHGIHDNLKDCGSTTKQFILTFHSKTMRYSDSFICLDLHTFHSIKMLPTTMT